MHGIAIEQGWGGLDKAVHGSVSNPRKCNRDATYQNVLSMTGTSPDISKPRFNYDTFGTDCYDVLSAYVQENNPEGLSASDWKDKYGAWGPLSLFLSAHPELSLRPTIPGTCLPRLGWSTPSGRGPTWRAALDPTCRAAILPGTLSCGPTRASGLELGSWSTKISWKKEPRQCSHSRTHPICCVRHIAGIVPTTA